MGVCQSSISALSLNSHHDFDHVDDSIHILLKRDIEHAKQNGIELSGYRPRQPHPLLVQREKQLQQEQQYSNKPYQTHVIAEEEEEDFCSLIQNNINNNNHNNKRSMKKNKKTNHNNVLSDHKNSISTATTETESITERSIESSSLVGSHHHSPHHNKKKSNSSRIQIVNQHRSSNQQKQLPINHEIENVLSYTKNHCDMIDPRDRRVYQ